MKVTRTFTVEQQGVGKPDYSREVFAGKERAGIALKYNQQFRAFGGNWTTGDPEYPLILDYNIAVGGKRHLRDSDTNELMPITLEAGYILSITSIGYTVTQDLLVYLYVDSLACISLGVTGGGSAVYENKLREFSTIWYDPTAALPHVLDIIAYNQGGAALYGAVGILCIVEALGTPPWPTTKECFCPYCNHKQTEPISATRITCKGCGKEYLVTNFASLRELG
ncbi:unnamed protein product [marine sediment metagenome]|uniref:Uncharacterized protein n=1 Tax=marine sediment metagenome TaxID=412755 RepID=X1R7J4_9ZZZZ